VAKALMGYSLQEFMKLTPNLWLKQYLIYIEINNPDGIYKEKPKPIRKQVTLDDIPFFN
jgi:hypothetical protein